MKFPHKGRILFTAFSLTALLSASALADSTRTSIDWDGTYEGVVPCASCEGIKTVLQLNEDGTYSLSETYLGKKTTPFVQTGTFVWGKKGDIVILEDDMDRRFLVGEGYVEGLNSDNQPAGQDYVLQMAHDHQTVTPVPDPSPAPSTEVLKKDLAKGEHFIGAGANLTILPNTLVDARMADTGHYHLVFDAVQNFEHVMEGGHKSILVTYDIDCTAMAYALPAVAYYTGEDASGDLLEQVEENNENWLPLKDLHPDDVLLQIRQKYCKS